MVRPKQNRWQVNRLAAELINNVNTEDPEEVVYKALKAHTIKRSAERLRYYFTDSEVELMLAGFIPATSKASIELSDFKLNSEEIKLGQINNNERTRYYSEYSR